jgi:hypothetical protein
MTGAVVTTLTRIAVAARRPAAVVDTGKCSPMSERNFEMDVLFLPLTGSGERRSQ